ncbi:hypothetical protein FQR65_LT08066 [Abscondita terminalis]|nr:hypothetical protein FQR65_LT08066 [Abscondita terminalis]
MTSRHRGSLTTRSLPKSYPQKATMNSYTTEHSCDCDEDEPNSTTPINNTYKVSSQSRPPQKSALDGTTDYSRFASLVESTGTSSNAFPTRSSPARSPLQNSTIRNYTVEESSDCGKDQYESLPNNTTYQVTSPKGLHQTINYSKFTPPVQSTHMTNKYEESAATQSSPAAFFSTTMSNYSSDCYSDGSKASSQRRVPQRSALDQTINYSRFSPLVQSTPIGTKEQRVPQNATYTVTPGNTTKDLCFCGDETESVNTESDTVGGDYTDTSGSQNPYNSTSSTLNNSSKRVKFSKSSSTVQTYTEESEDLGEEPKVIRTTSKIETAATGIRPSEISMSETRSTPSGQSSRRNMSGETISGETINLDNLRQLEEQERTQLAEDLRRMQEARRQLALHAASIGGSTNLL